MLSRTQRRARERMVRRLQRDIAVNGIESFLSRLFGAAEWRYDARENLWIVPNRRYAGPGRQFYCFRGDGSWFMAQLGTEHTQ